MINLETIQKKSKIVLDLALDFVDQEIVLKDAETNSHEENDFRLGVCSEKVILLYQYMKLLNFMASEKQFPQQLNFHNLF